MILHDVQNRPDERGIAIDRVGVRDLRYPIVVLDREAGRRETVGRLSLSAHLPHHFKGTHMSRFIEVLNGHRSEITVRTLPSILSELRSKLDAESAHIVVEFPYFLAKAAPASGAIGYVDYDCFFEATSSEGTLDFVLGVRVPVTTLCPCSKEISDYGAHNQRGQLTVELRSFPDEDGSPAIVWIEEVIEVAESAGSSPVYSLLKRPDERAVTMQAYDNPVFVEDMVRHVAARLQADERISWFRAHALNFESIHNHNAFAEVVWSRQPDGAAS